MEAVTVAVPTARRAASLQRLLAALPAAMAGVDAPVLVVDNAPSQPARDVVAAAPLPVRYAVEPRAGSAYARNTALAQVQTPLVAFLDDDVVPRPGWLPALLAGMAAGAVAAGGRVVLDPLVLRPAWLPEEGIGGYLSAHDLGPLARPLQPGEYLLTANAVFSVAALRAIGGFDPRLGPRPGSQLVADDVHVVRQLQAHGGTVVWQPEAVVEHELPEARMHRRWLLRRAYLQGRSDWLLDEAELRRRRAGGARVALDWLLAEVAARRGERLRRQDVRFHLATDVARTVGAVRQGLGWRGDRPPQ